MSYAATSASSETQPTPGPRTVALVGHCGPDSSYLRMAVGGALPGTAIVMIDDDAALAAALDARADLLLLVNRVLEFGFGAHLGVELIRELRATRPATRAMLVSNYPDAQAAALAEGALPGFGKRDIGTPRVAKSLQDAFRA